MNIRVSDNKNGIQYWINKSFIGEELRKTLNDSDILIVPFENIRQDTPPLFPTGTDLILEYLKDNLPKDIKVDICIEDTDYALFEFNSHNKNLGKFVVSAVVFPIFLNVISNFIYENYIKPTESKPSIEFQVNVKEDVEIHNYNIENYIKNTDKEYLLPSDIKVNITVEKEDGKSINIEYEGPAKEFKEVMSTIKENE